MTQTPMVRVKALRVFTKTTEHGQFHGDPNSHLEEGRNPLIPASVLEELADRGCVIASDDGLPQLDHDGDGHAGGSKSPEGEVDLTELRKQYEKVVGKRPFPGWGADELNRRMVEAADQDGPPA